MTEWIREADTRPAKRKPDAPRACSVQTTLTTTTLTRKEQPEKKRSPGQIEKLKRKMQQRHGPNYSTAARPEPKQVTLDKNLRLGPMLTDSETESETEEESAGPSRAVANGHSLYMNAQASASPNAEASRSKKRKADDQPSQVSSNSSSETESDATQPLPWAPRTPPGKNAKKLRKKRKMNVKSKIALPLSSAISPSRRLTILEQSAKEAALAQSIARSSPATRKQVLSPSVRSPARSERASIRSITSSPLREGFSLIDLGSQALGEFASEHDSDDASDDLDSSPLGSRSKVRSGMSRIQYALSPSSKRKIFAFETLASDAQVDLNESMDLAGTEIDELHQDQTQVLDDLQRSSSSLSSPPPPQRLGVVDLQGSSQTEPGGSWCHQESSDPPMTQRKPKKRATAAETYVSDMEVPTDNSDDQTYEESQWVGDTTAKPRRMTRALSASLQRLQTPEPEDMAMRSAAEGAAIDQENDTQPLPWNDSQQEQVTTSRARARMSSSDPLATRTSSQKPKDWVSLSQAWPQHILHDSTNRMQASKRQSGLAQFGFSRDIEASKREQAEAARRRRASSPMSEAEDISSDGEEVQVRQQDKEAHMSTDSSRLPLASEDDSETQSLPWSDAEAAQDDLIAPQAPDKAPAASHPSSDGLAPSSSQSSIDIPSDSGLNSQLRAFLDAL